MAKFLFVLTLAVWTDFSAAKIRFACPVDHFCLPREHCQKENVYVGHRANAKHPVAASMKFMCGKFISSEGHVCCNTQESLPEKFEPTPEKWFYGESDQDLEDDLLDTQVVPWPGHGTKPLSEDNAVPKDLQTVPDDVIVLPEGAKLLCPDNAYCLRPFLCPMKAIVFSTYGLQDSEEREYECGSLVDTEGYVCCKGEVVTSAMYSYIIKEEEENSSTFVVSRMGKSFLRIFKRKSEQQQEKLINFGLTRKRKEKPKPEKPKPDTSTSEESADDSVLEGGKARRRRRATEGVYRN